MIQKLSEKEELLDKAKKIQKIKGFGTVCSNATTIYLSELGLVSNKRIAAKQERKDNLFRKNLRTFSELSQELRFQNHYNSFVFNTIRNK